MKLSDQVVSLELSKKLKSLNVKQESLFTHIFHPYYEWVIYSTENVNASTYRTNERYSAFSCSELLELIPELIICPEYGSKLLFAIDIWQKTWRVMYIHEDSDGDGCPTEIDFQDKNIIEASGKMLIHLIENQLVKVEDMKNDN